LQYQTTLGPIQPHTEAKHDILKYHMGAWFPILGRSFSEPIQYIDGFAGPGEYEGGEPGSPIIALEVVRTHRYLLEFVQAGKRFEFLFVERERLFANHLRQKLLETAWPSAFNIEVAQADFESVMVRLLDEVDAGRRRMPPTLLFIDPFGSAGFTMGVLARLARHSRIDLLINFNYVDLVRWILPDPVKHTTLDALYGSERWRSALRLTGEERKEFLIREYGLALHDAGRRNTNVEMINNQNQTQYYLFFGTGNRSPRGIQAIKQAMRSGSPDGLFRYADRSDPDQLRFMGMDVEYGIEMADHLYLRYSGREVTKETLIDDEVAWHSRWIEKDLTAALRLLESSAPPRITDVRNLDGRPRRRASFPTGCIITFAM